MISAHLRGCLTAINKIIIHISINITIQSGIMYKYREQYMIRPITYEATWDHW